MIGHSENSFQQYCKDTMTVNMIAEGNLYRSSPDTERYTNAWDWDNALGIIGYTYTDPEFAIKVLASTARDYIHYPWGRQITLTNSAGWIEKNITFPLLRGHSENKRIDALTQSPIIGICMLNAIENLDRDDGWKHERQRNNVIKHLTAGLESRYLYLLENIVDLADGLPVTIHPYEDGTDAEPDSFLQLGIEIGDDVAFLVRGTEVALLNKELQYNRPAILEAIKTGIARPKWMEKTLQIASPILHGLNYLTKHLNGKHSELADYARAIDAANTQPAKLYAKKHVMFAAAAASGMDAVSQLNRMNGKVEEAEEWESHARAMWENIFAKMYNSETHSFQNLLSSASEQTPNEIIWDQSPYQTASGLTPLLCPYDDLLEKYEIDPKVILNKAVSFVEFGGACGVNYIWNRHVKQLSGAEEPLWLNTYYSWVPPNYLIWKAAITHNLTDIAQQIALSITTAIEEYGAWEQHCGISGKGVRTPDFTWTVALYLEMKNWLEEQEVQEI